MILWKFSWRLIFLKYYLLFIAFWLLWIIYRFIARIIIRPILLFLKLHHSLQNSLGIYWQGGFMTLYSIWEGGSLDLSPLICYYLPNPFFFCFFLRGLLISISKTNSDKFWWLQDNWFWFWFGLSIKLLKESILWRSNDVTSNHDVVTS